MRQAPTARDLGTPESMKNGEILDVFPVFHTALAGQKIRCPAEAELFKGSIETSRPCLSAGAGIGHRVRACLRQVMK